MDGEATPGNQWVAPTNRYYAKNVPVPKRDVARAKQLLKEAGVPNPSFTLMTPTTSDAQRIAQVVQAMAKEAGFDVKIQSTEFATSLNLADKGAVRGLRARLERPRRPRRQHLQLRRLQAAAQLRRLLQARGRRRCINQSRTTLDPAQRAKLFEQIAQQRAEGPADRLPLPPQLAVGATRAKLPGCAPSPTAWCACRA